MNSQASAHDAAAEAVSAVTVAVLCDTMPLPSALREALTGLAPGTSWTVVTNVYTLPIDIALCDSTSAVASAAALWPDAGVIAIVEPRDDGSMVRAALQAGADVCLRRADVRLTAAYVRSVARRRELTADSAADR